MARILQPFHLLHGRGSGNASGEVQTGALSPRILVVDSSPELRETIGSVLRRQCFEVEDAGDGEAALAAATRGPVDLVLLDLQLRRVSGLDVLRRLRSVSTVPVIAMTTTNDEVDRVLALELGADDCVTIPCSLAELVSRVRALLRRCEYERAATRGPIREIGGLRVDLGLRQVVVDERLVYLTGSQFKLLSLLSEDPGRIISRREILHRLWDSSHAADDHVCDVHVSNLRHKIERDPRNPERIVTVRGLGYKLVAV
jgi:two-component system, OmpR family, response regulator RegX3